MAASMKVSAPGYSPRRTLPFTVEFVRQLRRRRTMIAFGLLLVLPWILVGAFEVSGSSSAGNGTPGLVAVATQGGLNFAAFSIFVSAARPAEEISPGTDFPGPRRRHRPRRQRLVHRRMSSQPFHPAHRPRRRAAGDPGLPLQPRPRTRLTILLKPALGGERGQHRRPSCGVLGLGPFQYPQAVRLLRRRQRRHISAVQAVQRRLQHDQSRGRSRRGGRGGGLLRDAHSAHVLPAVWACRLGLPSGLAVWGLLSKTSSILRPSSDSFRAEESC